MNLFIHNSFKTILQSINVSLCMFFAFAILYIYIVRNKFKDNRISSENFDGFIIRKTRKCEIKLIFMLQNIYVYVYQRYGNINRLKLTNLSVIFILLSG